jgi:hypothetical protein
MTKPFRIVDKDRAEEADVVVCMRVSEGDPFRFDDNVFGRCADCKHAIFWRPYNPKKPAYVCVHCALDRAGIPEDRKQFLKDELAAAAAARTAK